MLLKKQNSKGKSPFPLKQKLLYSVFSLGMVLILLQCNLPIKSKKSKAPEIQIQFFSEDYEETKSIPSSLLESKDLLLILAELSKKEDPSMRFISTNRTEEIMEVNGKRNSWSEGWVVYVNEERVDGVQMKRGVRVGPSDKIEIRYEAVERVFGRPTP
ncbi:hypothetical protein LEP1GSC203_2553 [Leptospira terpstrae serovar Hualin str. LT 11-33 = ATCC 700639]|uniref:Uncharacterized protein n=1 Tax=Leptospira terpstrae serovar Hualin str. LT 11-33 = ATCC 700639 TaxID=1257025 RepID=N1VTI5_9LEPT|nr:hypothetical protein LEP1GSC203_2553 [Leptospira terpstrae serovar Hualin str. LT 11-33 = ATCC 700639]